MSSQQQRDRSSAYSRHLNRVLGRKPSFDEYQAVANHHGNLEAAIMWLADQADGCGATVSSEEDTGNDA